jgi:hypothetical protein
LVIICCAQRSKIILTPWQHCCSFRLASLLVEKCARSCHCDFTLSPRFSRRRLLVCQPWPVSSLCSAWHYVILSMLGMCGLKKIQHESNVWRCIRIVHWFRDSLWFLTIKNTLVATFCLFDSNVSHGQLQFHWMGFL